MANKFIENCPVCQKRLSGKLIIFIFDINGVLSKVVYELANPNWMICRLCHRILCKQCGADSEKSYCHLCREPSDMKQMPLDLEERIAHLIRNGIDSRDSITDKHTVH